MTLEWQTWIAAAVVALAAGVIARRVWLWATLAGSGGCSHCPNRGAPSTVKSLPLVQIQPPRGES